MPKRKPQPATSLGGISQADARRYRAEEAMRTIQRADEHRKDRGLMKDVKTIARKHVATMSKLAK